VKGFYRAYMHQGPSTAELKRALRFLAGGGAMEQLQAQILGSAAYFKKRARRNNARFLAAVAQDVLGHPLDAASLQQYSALLAQGASRTTVALLILRQKATGPGPTQPPIQPPVQPPVQPPTILLAAPPPEAGPSNTNAAFAGQVAGDLSQLAALQVQVDTGTPANLALDAGGTFHYTTALPLDGSADGRHAVRFQALGTAGTVLSSVVASFTLDTRPPVLVVQTPMANQVITTNVAVAGQLTDNVSGPATLRAQVDAGTAFSVPIDGTGSFSFDTTLAVDGGADGSHTVRLVAADRAGNTTSRDVPFTLSTTTLTNDSSAAATVGASTQWLYTGSNPPQTGVAPGTIDPLRAAVLRGKVLARDGSPLAGVEITVLNHPELGVTHTQADGIYSMAVNGGGLLTVRYRQAGFLEVQRQVDAPWQDYAWAPDVVLIPQDNRVTTIDRPPPRPSRSPGATR
jgi:hypothetical protein